jgi:hypothetical protein
MLTITVVLFVSINALNSEWWGNTYALVALFATNVAENSDEHKESDVSSTL